MRSCETQIYISLGGGTDLGITKDDHLVVIERSGYRVDLGLATAKRIDEIREYLNRLKIHAVEEKVLPADSVAKAAGEALNELYPWGYRSEDKEP